MFASLEKYESFYNEKEHFFEFKPFSATYFQFNRLYHRIEKSSSIPPIIFRMCHYDYNEVPIEIQHVLTKALELNQHYIQVYMNDVDCVSFLNEYYPDYVDLFNSLIPGAFRSDLVRLCLLYHFGGVYSDIGHLYVSSLSKVIKPDTELVLTSELDCKEKYPLCQPGIHNAFIAAKPKHEFIHAMMIHVTNNVRDKYYGLYSLDITGPWALYDCYKKFFSDNIPPGSSGERTVYHEDKPYCYQLCSLVPSKLDGFYNIEYKGETILQTKFINYNQVVYGSKKDRPYGELWKERTIYRKK